MQKLITLGILFVFIGIIMLFLGSLFSSVKSDKSNVKSAGGVFIGPFPLFGWASDKDMFYTLMIIVVTLTLLWLIFFRRF